MKQQMTTLERIDQVCADAIEDGVVIDEGSLARCLAFFQADSATAIRPKLTLTPQGTFRAHWLATGETKEF